MKKLIFTLFICLSITLSMSGSIHAQSESDNLLNIWNNKDGKVDVKINYNNEIVTLFESNNQKYETKEKVSKDNSIVITQYYKVNDNELIALGSTKTYLNQQGNRLNIVVYQNNEKIAQVDLQNNQVPLENSNNLFMKSTGKTEYKWFYQGSYNGSNKILKFTIGAITAALAGSIGGAAGGALGYVAGEIINEHIKVVYWHQKTWVYLMRTPGSASYPNWIQAGKYKYQTSYYRDAAHTSLIRTVTRIDG
ncbi:MAG: hypothetical protein ACI32Q_05730 [Intestinibaculum porci]|uniref:hypothetical protein n=1 Tax=Intestinibaculum porci TaxID=2487118 RepID=UPI003F0DCCBE